MSPDELKRRRLALGLSQRKLAARLTVHWNTLARWERGERRIENPAMLDLALQAIERSQPPSRETHQGPAFRPGPGTG